MRICIALSVSLITALLIFALPVSAAPVAQTSIPDFTLNAQTTISVTVALTGGQVIVVPVGLRLVAQNDNGSPEISLIAEAEQQTGIFIGIATSREIETFLQSGLVAPISAVTPEPTATRGGGATSGGNTYVVNANANLRAGPGTNFEIIGSPRFGDIVVIVGQNEDGTWMQLEGGGWIAEFLVDRTADNPNTGNTVVPSATPTPTEAVEPGVTAEPEVTDDAEATPTTTPTATPTPTPPPAEAESSPELAAYVQQILDNSASMGNTIAVMSALLQNPQPFNEAWAGQVTTQLATVSVALDQYLALIPVPGYEDFHSRLIDAVTICEQAVDYVSGGLQDPRPFSPTLAVDLVQSCAIQATDISEDVQTLQ